MFVHPVTPEEWSVQQAAEQLRGMPFDQLARHFDPQRMTEQDVYPSVIWKRDEDALSYLRLHYEKLVRFFDAAATSGSGAIMSLG